MIAFYSVYTLDDVPGAKVSSKSTLGELKLFQGHDGPASIYFGFLTFRLNGVRYSDF